MHHSVVTRTLGAVPAGLGLAACLASCDVDATDPFDPLSVGPQVFFCPQARFLHEPATSAANVYFLIDPGGCDHLAVHFDGSTWTDLPSDTLTPTSTTALWGPSPDTLFLVGSDIVRYYDASWHAMDWPGVSRVDSLNDVWGTAGDNVYAVGTVGLLHFDGAAWAEVELDAPSNGLNAVRGAAPDDVYAVGSDCPDLDAPCPAVIVHFDGADWTRVGPETEHLVLRDVWQASATSVFVVGTDYSSYSETQQPEGGVILHFNGTDWTTTEVDQPLALVWGASDSTVFAAGSNLLRFDGGEWRTMDGAVEQEYSGLWGTAADDFFTAGSHGIRHFDGSSWFTIYLLTNGRGTPGSGPIWGFAQEP